MPLDTPELTIIRDRISSFKLSFCQQVTFTIDTHPDLYKEIKLYGNVLFNEKEQEKFFACCASPDCYTDPTLHQTSKPNKLIKMSSELNNNCMSWVTSNAIKHLELQHGILGKNSKKQRDKINTEEEERHEMKLKFKGNMARLCELQWPRMVVLARLPFSMINRILIYAFGDRNPSMEKEIAEMKLTVGRIRDHTKDGTFSDEIVEEENPDASNMQLKTKQSQRFMSVFFTSERFNKMHESIKQICGEAQIENEVTLEKEEIEQLMSLLKPLRIISVQSLKQKEAFGFRIMQKLISERLTGSLQVRSQGVQP